MANLKANEREELAACEKLLARTKEDKLEWNFDIAGQAWCSANGIFFSLYFPNAEVLSSDRWRQFVVQNRESDESDKLVNIFVLGNPNDPVAVSRGIRIATREATAVLDEVTSIVIHNQTRATYDRVLNALDSL